MINKVKKFLKNNIKNVIAFVVGVVISGGTVYAATELFASDIKFNNQNSNLSSTTVQGAIDELSIKASNSISIAPPKYFLYGDPTTGSTQNYTELNSRVFNGLYESGNKAVCIVRNGNLICFKKENFEKEKIHLKQVFSDVTCTSDGGVQCTSTDFTCSLASNGDIWCDDNQSHNHCYVGITSNSYCE